MSKRMIALLSLNASLLVCLVVLPALAAEEDEEPKYEIKEVMKQAMKGPLLKKVAAGDASEEETKTLSAMMTALAKNEPPKGEAESWKKLTGALVKASKMAVEGDEGAGEALKKAANCKACHSKHK